MPFNNKRIIVSMTSWEKRIQNVSKVVFSILSNDIKPDLIVCNLSIEEFKNKEKDLPNDLVLLQKKSCFEINWVKRNTTVFKKFIPTLKRFYPENYYLFTIDDDELYHKDYIKCGINALQNHDACVISIRDKNETGVWGGRFCCNSNVFGDDYWKNINEDLIKYGMNDPYTNVYFKYKGISVYNVYEKKSTVFNPVHPNRNGKKYDENRKELVYKTVYKIFEDFKI